MLSCCFTFWFSCSSLMLPEVTGSLALIIVVFVGMMAAADGWPLTDGIDAGEARRWHSNMTRDHSAWLTSRTLVTTPWWLVSTTWRIGYLVSDNHGGKHEFLHSRYIMIDVFHHHVMLITFVQTLSYSYSSWTPVRDGCFTKKDRLPIRNW